ncbi:type II secretion system protein GspN [bacterium]|nr:type II secretion system protein GspN [bacterium]
MAKVKKSTVFICLGVFLVGLLFFFPLQNLKGLIFQKIFESTGVLIVAEEIHPIFFGWPGIGIKNVNVTLPAGGSDIELASRSMTFRVRLSSAFIPSVSLAFDELKGGGDLFLLFGQSGAVTRIVAESDKLNLGQIVIPGLGRSLGGLLESDVSLKYNDAIFSETSGRMNLAVANFKFPATSVNNPMLGPPFQIPELNAGNLDVKLKFQDGVMSVSSFKLGTPQTDVSGGISGEMKMGANIFESQINLTLKLVFSPKIQDNPEYKTFLDFLGAYRTSKSGEYAMNWNASLQQLMSNPLPSPLR